jgi:hypothetical protein
MSTRTIWLLAPALTAALLLPCWGCGQGRGSTGSKNLVRVKGKVTYKGQPVTKGSVVFEPEGYGRRAKGLIQSDGSYALSTFAEGEGVVAGAHRVMINGFDKPLAKDRALKKYGQLNASGLTADVDADRTEFNFDLK